jgi:hypothetical protein
MFHRGLLIIALFLFAFPVAAAGYDDFRLEGTAYNPAVPTPEDVIGHALGKAPVRHHKLVEYIRQIAEASPRMTVETIGYSHERRPILFIVVTSPQNHARLDDIRAAHIRLTDPASGVAPEAGMPVVTWLNYGVHGAEASGMDAALPSLYHLAAAEGEAIEAVLRDSVILITAVFNPDGHSRRAAWVDQNLSKAINRDRAHRLHNTAWPGGRTNHYWFDLNRQWLLLTQPEPRAWVAKWHQWRPNLSIDYHEMGPDQTYYFHPGVPGRTNPHVPEEAEALLLEYADYPASFMDAEARLYFNQEIFDNFYIGKGSTYPLVNGAIGVLFEAGRALGGEVQSDAGIKSYRDNIRTHFRTSLKSIEAGAGMREKLLDYQMRFYQNALAAAGRDRVKAYVFAAPGDPARVNHFIDVLRRHRIQVHRLASEVSAKGKKYAVDQAYIVPTAQPQYRMIAALFETTTEFENNTFYDVSAWTLPLSFDLDYGAVESRRLDPAMLGAAVDAIFEKAPGPDQAPFAYAFDWSHYYAPKSLYRVVSNGLLARTSSGSLTLNTTKGPIELSRGSIIVPLERQTKTKAEIHAIMKAVAEEDGIPVHAVTAGRAVSGGDLGGPSMAPVTSPKVLMAIGPGTSAYDAGEIWHLLDHRMRIPLTMTDLEDLADFDLTHTTHLILPGGDYGKQNENLEKKMAEWVQSGGVLIAIRQGAEWAHDKVLYPDKKKAEELPKASQPERLLYAEKDRLEALDLVAGTIFRGQLDNTHPIGFGYADTDIASQRNTMIIFERPKNPYASVVQYAEEPLLSGYASAENQKKIAGTAMLIAERKGEGSVILFADNPNFRGIWFGNNKLFLNGLFFGTHFEPPQ